jgi:hypothetical protein
MENKLFLTPSETVQMIIGAGRRVLHQSFGRTFVLSLLAGFYISFGAQLSTIVSQDAACFAGLGVSRLLAGSVFFHWTDAGSDLRSRAVYRKQSLGCRGFAWRDFMGKAGGKLVPGTGR